MEVVDDGVMIGHNHARSIWKKEREKGKEKGKGKEHIATIVANMDTSQEVAGPNAEEKVKDRGNAQRIRLSRRKRIQRRRKWRQSRMRRGMLCVQTV